MEKYSLFVNVDNMDKYIGNKKSILPEIERFMRSKGIVDGVLIDAFSGTTNVAQYFKQKGFSIICNDANAMSYVLGKAYIENNDFPNYLGVTKYIEGTGFKFDEKELLEDIEYVKRKINHDILFSANYYETIKFGEGIKPLAKVLQYLNHLPVTRMNVEEKAIFEHYCEGGKSSSFISSRGLSGKRNYFTEKNAKLLGRIIVLLKKWNDAGLLSESEKYVLLAALIEEVTLNANVNGTFHDFNRNKLYPNALVPLHLKPIMLNIFPEERRYSVYVGGANVLKDKIKLAQEELDQSSLYIDPPYNFRQYGAYYHFLNFLAEIYEIDSIKKYLESIQYVRGQNMDNNFVSDYCYKDKFIAAMSDLINNLNCKNILISYYDENNHWNHGKEVISFEGRDAIKNMLLHGTGIVQVNDEPFVVQRKNYQSQSGAHKKKIDELVFYGTR